MNDVVNPDAYERLAISARDNGLYVVSLNRPEKRNALDVLTIEELIRFFSGARIAGVKAVLLAGEGDHFCAGLDLVEVAPGDTPVTKILDYGKMRFEAQKKKAANRKSQRTSALKEIKMRPNIDTHDYMVKTKKMTEFFERGDKVKVTVRFRGREMAHMDRGADLLNRVKEDFEELAKVEFAPKTEGRLMVMVMAPR